MGDYDPNFLSINGANSYNNLSQELEDILAGSIEIQLQVDTNMITDKDIVFYLSYKSNQAKLDPDDMNSTKNYISDIIKSYSYENIFVNTSNYSSLTTMYIGLLLPFFYTYPRFYKLNYLGIFIGFGCFLGLAFRINKLYSPLIKDVRLDVIYMICSFVFYFIFVVLLNKLNHLSLFYLCAASFFSIYNWIIRLRILGDSEMNSYRAKLLPAETDEDANLNYAEYDIYIEGACLELNSRWSLSLPTGNILYSYFTQYEIGSSDSNEIGADIAANIVSPLLSIIIMWFISKFLLQYNEMIDTPNDKNTFSMKPFPIIGFFNNEQTKRFYSCQANYVLPEELNLSMLIHPIIDKYKIRDPIWFASIEKALVRITNELLAKYNPKFCRIHDSDMTIIKQESIVLEKIKAMIGSKYATVYNKIKDGLDDQTPPETKEIAATFEELLEQHKERKGDKDKDTYITLFKRILDESNKREIDHKKKKILKDFINHVENGILIINDYNFNYNEDSKEDYILAKNELLYNDLKLKKKFKDKTPEYRKKLLDQLKEIIDDYIIAFKKNLSIKGDSRFPKNKLKKYQEEYQKELDIDESIIDTELYNYTTRLEDGENKDPKKLYGNKKIHTINENGQLTSKLYPYEKTIKEKYDVNKPETYLRYSKGVIDKKKDLLQEGGDYPPDLEEENYNTNKSDVRGIYTIKPVFGYHYNIITHNMFHSISSKFKQNPWNDESIRRGSSFFLDFMIGILSIWFIFAKAFGTPWFITKLILLRNDPMKLIQILSRNYDGFTLIPRFIWKYFTCGLDHSYFEDKYKESFKMKMVVQSGGGVEGAIQATSDFVDRRVKRASETESEIGKSISETASNIGKGVSKTAKDSSDFFKPALNNVKSKTKIKRKKAKEGLNDSYKRITDFGYNVVTGVGEVVGKGLSYASKPVTYVGSKIGTGVNSVTTAAGIGPISEKTSKGVGCILDWVKTIFYHLGLMITIAGFLYFYNSSMFGLTFNPLWQNTAIQAVFIILISVNIYILSNKKIDRKKNIFVFNIAFLSAITLVMAIVVIVLFVTGGSDDGIIVSEETTLS
jgi:hypothetical protein